MGKNTTLLKKALANDRIDRHISQTLLTIDNATLSDEGSDYKSLYYFLFNGITDILALNAKHIDPACLPICAETVDSLKRLQYNAEELFLNQMD